MFYNDQRAALMEKLVNLAPAGLNRAYLCNSGAEAVEATLEAAPVFGQWVLGGSLTVALTSTYATSGTYALQLGAPVSPTTQGEGQVRIYQKSYVDPACVIIQLSAVRQRRSG